MKKKEIYKEYQENKCSTDYHDDCSGAWKGCDSHDSRTFCPMSCGSKNCYQLRFFGYLNPHERPKFDNGDCKDSSSDCDSRKQKGDCLSKPEDMSTSCPKTAGTCGSDKDYLPYMPEENKIQSWCQRYKGGKYSQFSKYMETKRTIVQSKIQSNSC